MATQVAEIGEATTNILFSEAELTDRVIRDTCGNSHATLARAISRRAERGEKDRPKVTTQFVAQCATPGSGKRLNLWHLMSIESDRVRFAFSRGILGKITAAPSVAWCLAEIALQTVQIIRHEGQPGGKACVAAAFAEIEFIAARGRALADE